jgi:hypothetical protein
MQDPLKCYTATEPQRDSKESTASIFRVKKVQEDRERTATLACENGNS